MDLGGHDFSSRPPDRAVCELLLRLASERGGERPKICILPTASGDTSEQIGRFYAAFGERSCEPSDVSLFRRREHEGNIRSPPDERARPALGHIP